MAIDTAMLGGLAAAFGASEYHQRTAWCYLFIFCSAGGMVVAIFCAGMAAIPRMFGPINSLIFFARIAEKKESDYIGDFSVMTEKSFLADLTTQIHRNAEIANAKHQWVRKSLYWSFLSAIPWIVAIGMLVKS